jgi:hypothetical protein
VNENWNMRHLLLCAVAAVIPLSGCQREISGTYVAKFTDGVCWLQLVRTPDNHLTGQLEALILGADGRIERKAVPVTGAVNAGNVTISASSLFGLQVVTLSGTLDGNKLTLMGVQPNPVVLTRSDLGEYQRQVTALNVQSQRIVAARDAAVVRERNERIQRNTISEIDRVLGGMQTFDSEADVHLSRFPGAEQRYRAITAKMTEYVDRERQLTGGPSAAVARGQLSVAATRASIATIQLHNSARSLQSLFQTNVQPLAAEATDLEQGCRAAPPSDLTPAQKDARNAACRRLLLADALFREKFAAMEAGLVHLEQVYAKESTAQQSLLQSAQRMQ